MIAHPLADRLYKKLPLAQLPLAELPLDAEDRRALETARASLLVLCGEGDTAAWRAMAQPSGEGFADRCITRLVGERLLYFVEAQNATDRHAVAITAKGLARLDLSATRARRAQGFRALHQELAHKGA